MTKIQKTRCLVRSIRGFFPLTLTGFLLLALSCLTFWFVGIKRQDLVLLAVGFIGGLMALLMVLLTTAAAPLIHCRFQRGATRSGLALECESLLETGFLQPLPRWLPLLECSWTWEYPLNTTVQTWTHRDRHKEFILSHRRGSHREIRRRITLRDVLGLTAIEWTVKELSEIRFLPAKGALDRMTLLDGLTGGDDLSDPRGRPEGDRIDMRQYTPGDSPRMILWKVYARSRKLLVRVPEHAVTARQRFCAYFIAGDGDEPGAGFMRTVLERGFLGENWRFGADGTLAFTGRADEALDFLIRSSGAAGETGAGLSRFLNQAQLDGFAACLVVVPPIPGAWTAETVSSLDNAGLRIHAFTVLNGTAASPAHPSWEKAIYMRKADEGKPLQDLAGMARSFGHSQFPLFVLNRATGTVIGDVRNLGTQRKTAQGERS